MLVCRDWYPTALPLIWQHAFFSRNSALQAFVSALDSRSTIAPRPPHSRWHRNGCFVRCIDLSRIDLVNFRSSTDSDEVESDESEAVRPLRRSRSRRSGQLAKTNAGGGVDIVTLFSSCPLLERIILGAGTTRIPTKMWNDLYSRLQHPNLVALRGVSLPHSRPETVALLDVLNDMPSLAEFSATSIALQADLAMSMLEIFKMNEKLVSVGAEIRRDGKNDLRAFDQASHKTGLNMGGGLRELCWGGECELPFSFLVALPRACPNLRA